MNAKDYFKQSLSSNTPKCSPIEVPGSIGGRQDERDYKAAKEEAISKPMPLNGIDETMDYREVERSYSHNKEKFTCSWDENEDNPFKTCFICDFGMQGATSIMCMDMPPQSLPPNGEQVYDRKPKNEKNVLPDRLLINKEDIPLVEIEDNIFEALTPIKPIKEGKSIIADRINLASAKSGAMSLAKAKSTRDIGNILNSNVDKYSTSPCKSPKWFIIGLAEMV